MGSESQARSLKNLFGFGNSQQQPGQGVTERGRTHGSSSSQVDGVPRRASSQAPAPDRRRGRTSSAAPPTQK